MGISRAVISKVKYAVKAADQTCNNDSTLNYDDTLYFGLLPNGIYEFECSVHIMAENSTPGFKYYLTKTATDTIMPWGGVRPAITSTADNNALDKINLQGNTSAWSDSCVVQADTNNGVWIYISCIFQVVSGSGTIAFAWCQNAAHASNTTVKAGSYARLERT